jgi:HD-GYP domain-containing protein (c-di-GMP phosphodiesterase class II)
MKPGAPTSEEWIVMRGHVQTGYNLVSRIPLLHQVAELVFSHHERFDATGYPRKLRAEQISLCARIFAVADAFDAMTMPRRYQATRTISQAIREIRRLTGQQFDAEVVNAFLSVPVQILQTIHPGSNAEPGAVLQIENDSPDRLAVAAG